MRVLIAGHFNLNNGDRAVLESTIQYVLENFDDPHIVVSAFKPELLKDSRFSAVGWPLKHFRGSAVLARAFLRNNRRVPRILLRSDYLGELARADLVLVSGGHHLTDLLGLNALYNLLTNFVIPIQAGKKVVLLPQSVGPFDTWATDADLKVVSAVLRKADRVYIRDESSVKCLSENFPNCEYESAPDLVYGLRPHSQEVCSKSVGIALYCSYATEAGKQRMRNVQAAIKAVCYRLNQSGYGISIIPMESRNYSGDDRPAAKAIIEDLQVMPGWDSSCSISVQEADDPLDVRTIVRLFSGKRVVIGCKTHSVVFCATVGTPVVAVAYHKKSVDFMNSMGLGEYSIMDHEVNEARLWDLVSSVLEEESAIRKAQQEFVERSRVQIGGIFQELSKGVS